MIEGNKGTRSEFRIVILAAYRRGLSTSRRTFDLLLIAVRARLAYAVVRDAPCLVLRFDAGIREETRMNVLF